MLFWIGALRSTTSSLDIQVILNQVATLADINFAMRDHGDTATSVEVADSTPSNDPLLVEPKQRIAQPPPAACFLPDGVESCRLHDASFARLIYLDLTELTPGANLHSCQPTCHE